MRILIIGAGSIGERHLRNFLRIDGVQCSFVEPNEARRAEISAAYDAQHAFEQWTDADPDDFDGTVVCTPANHHVPLVAQLLDNGVTGILCEKPLATESGGIAELKQKIQARSASVGIAFCFRHHPVFVELRDRFLQGDLGEARAAFGFTSQYWPAMRPFWPPQYAVRRETGGGALSDHVVHLINFLEWTLGAVESVSAFQRHMELPDISTEDAGTISMRFAGGQIAVLTICLYQRNIQSQFELVGDTSTARIRLGADRLQIYRDASGDWEDGTAHDLDRDGIFLLQAKHFMACLRGEMEPRCTVAEAEQTLHTILAAVESSDGDSRFVACRQL